MNSFKLLSNITPPAGTEWIVQVKQSHTTQHNKGQVGSWIEKYIYTDYVHSDDVDLTRCIVTVVSYPVRATFLTSSK